MTSRSRRGISNAELARIVGSFLNDFVCWKVGLRFGSQIYFEMGEKLNKELKPGVVIPVGSSSLALEGYQWTISQYPDQVADSDSVSPEIVDDDLQPLFNKEKLESIKFAKENRTLTVYFSNHFVITSRAQLTGEYTDENLCLFVLPDGRVLGCDPRFGFFLDGSTSQVHARHYARVRA